MPDPTKPIEPVEPVEEPAKPDTGHGNPPPKEPPPKGD